MQGLVILCAYDYEGVEQAIAQGLLEWILVDWSPARSGLLLAESPPDQTCIACLHRLFARPGLGRQRAN